MKLDGFILENWLNPAADSPKNQVYLGGSCVLPLTLEELFEVTGEDMDKFFEELKTMNLGYPFFPAHHGCAEPFPGCTAMLLRKMLSLYTAAQVPTAQWSIP